MEKKVVQEVENYRKKILSLSNYLYENPEIALEEYKSSKKLVEFLKEEGFDVEQNLKGMPTAFRAIKRNGVGPRVAFIAEYDALPEVGHACGHHLIAAMSVGAGVALAASILDTYQGEISIIGTPAEETGEGKSHLVDTGVFEGIDATMMIHPFDRTCVTPEEIAIGGLDFIFTGKASHAGATPHNAINALDAVVLFFNNINALREQLIDGTRIHGIILEAGTAPNIIPEKGKVRLELRAKEMPYFEEVLEKVKNCARAAALATGCQLDFNHFEPTCQSLDEDPTLVEVFREAMAKFDIPEGEQVKSGSTDMGNVSQVVPAIQPVLKFVENSEDIHTKEFLEASIKPYAKEMTITGTKILALTGLTLFERPDLIKKMRNK